MILIMQGNRYYATHIESTGSLNTKLPPEGRLMRPDFTFGQEARNNLGTCLFRFSSWNYLRHVNGMLTLCHHVQNIIATSKVLHSFILLFLKARIANQTSGVNCPMFLDRIGGLPFPQNRPRTRLTQRGNGRVAYRMLKVRVRWLVLLYQLYRWSYSPCHLYRWLSAGDAFWTIFLIKYCNVVILSWLIS